MSYIGNNPNFLVVTDFITDYGSGDGVNTEFNLTVAPASVNSIDVVVDGVFKAPYTYSVNGKILTFSSAPPLGVNNVVVKHLGVVPASPHINNVFPFINSAGNSVNIKLATNLYLPFFTSSNNLLNLPLLVS